MSNGTFANGVQVNDGGPGFPAFTFINDQSTGIFRDGDSGVGISSKGGVPLIAYADLVRVVNHLQILPNAAKDATLISDAQGYAGWQPFPVISGATNVNTIYKSLPDATHITIPLGRPLPTPPNVILSQEADADVVLKFRITNKTTSSFDICPNSYIYQSINTGTPQIGEFAVTRLSNGCIGVVYYDVVNDQTMYVYSSDTDGTTWNTPIVVSNESAVGTVSIAVVDSVPAIAYITSGTTNQWKYIRSKDSDGSSWGTPVALMSSTVNVSFSPIGLSLQVFPSGPILFTNSQTGQAVAICSNDTIGTTWNAPVNISNLKNHQIVAVKNIGGRPAVAARSNTVNNIYYVRALDAKGATWPIGATEIFRADGSAMVVNTGDRCTSLNQIGQNLYIICSEATSNSIYIATANDANGASWAAFKFITTTNSAEPFLRVVTANNSTYLLYNDYNGSPSQINLLLISSPNSSSLLSSTTSRPLITSLDLCVDHIPLQNYYDNNSTIIMGVNNGLSVLQFYGDDYKINWFAKAN